MENLQDSIRHQTVCTKVNGWFIHKCDICGLEMHIQQPQDGNGFKVYGRTEENLHIKHFGVWSMLPPELMNISINESDIHIVQSNKKRSKINRNITFDFNDN